MERGEYMQGNNGGWESGNMEGNSAGEIWRGIIKGKTIQAGWAKKNPKNIQLRPTTLKGKYKVAGA